MSCVKGASWCDFWDGPMESCPGCEVAKKIPRAECSVCHMGLKVEIVHTPDTTDGHGKTAGIHIEVRLYCPNHKQIPYKGLRR